MVNTPHEIVLSMTAIMVLVLLLASFIFAIGFLFRQRWRKQLLQESYVRETLQSQLEIQNRTIQQTGQKLQDQIGQPLALTVNQLNALEKDLAGTPHGLTVKQALEKIVQTREAVQQLSQMLEGGTPRRSKLKESIALELEKIQRVGQFQTRFHSVGTPYILDEKTETILFSLVQEALNNAVNHSGGNQLTVTTNYTSDHLVLIITDDGCGFDVEETTQRTLNQPGSGLQNLQQRARLLGAECILNSQPGWGTRIEIRLPRMVA